MTTADSQLLPTLYPKNQVVTRRFAVALTNGPVNGTWYLSRTHVGQRLQRTPDEADARLFPMIDDLEAFVATRAADIADIAKGFTLSIVCIEFKVSRAIREIAVPDTFGLKGPNR